jgi:hypothetical protein
MQVKPSHVIRSQWRVNIPKPKDALHQEPAHGAAVQQLQ